MTRLPRGEGSGTREAGSRIASGWLRADRAAPRASVSDCEFPWMPAAGAAPIRNTRVKFEPTQTGFLRSRPEPIHPTRLYRGTPQRPLYSLLGRFYTTGGLTRKMSSTALTLTEPDQEDVLPWRSRAACRTTNPELFFSLPSDLAGIAEAKQICAACPVRLECLRAADSWGIWGGLTAAERGRSYHGLSDLWRPS